MPPPKKNKEIMGRKTVNDREVVPVKLMPSGVIGARYKDDEFSVIEDALGRPIPFKLIR